MIALAYKELPSGPATSEPSDEAGLLAACLTPTQLVKTWVVRRFNLG